jgi:hypothetical protein
MSRILLVTPLLHFFHEIKAVEKESRDADALSEGEV